MWLVGEKCEISLWSVRMIPGVSVSCVRERPRSQRTRGREATKYNAYYQTSKTPPPMLTNQRQ